jgi:TonB family protein
LILILGIEIQAQSNIASEILPDSLPQYNGGSIAMNEFISETIVYPTLSMENGEHGKAFVKFIVDSTGKVRNPEIIKSSGYKTLDVEAVTVIKKMPLWKPALLNNRPVNCNMTLPVAFKTGTLVGNEIVFNESKMNEDPYLTKGNAFYKKKKYYDAIENYRIYVKHFPKDYDTTTNLAYCYWMTNSKEKACTLWLKAKNGGSVMADESLKQYCTN